MLTRFVFILLAALLTTSTPTADARILKKTYPHVPNPARYISGATIFQTYLIGLPICGATTLMLSSIIRQRELTLQEAHVAVAGCVLPIIGPLIIRAIWRPEWDKLPTQRWERDFGVGRYS